MLKQKNEQPGCRRIPRPALARYMRSSLALFFQTKHRKLPRISNFITMTTRLYWLAPLFLSLLWLGCDRDQAYILPTTLEIFPHDAGHTRTMYVEDTTYTTAGLNAPLTINFYQRETVGELETDLMGRDIRLVNVDVSPVLPDSSFQFEPEAVWTQYFAPQPQGTYYAERTERNQRVRVLKFPVYPGIAWNGNLYNDQGPREFYYQAIDSTVTINGRSYPHCVVVIRQEQEESLIFDRWAYDIYAPGIGLIERYDRNLVFDQNGATPEETFNPSASYSRREVYVP